jgi:anti-sigma regulatory factor (Ser/Thr protein kinase)
VHQLTFDLSNDLGELPKLTTMLTRWGEQCRLPEPLVRQIELALDEILTNIVSYAYSDEAEHLIRIQLAADRREITAVVQDDGQPFNPLESAAPDTTAAIEERPVGGLGIHLVRELMDDIRYERVAAYNRLTITKVIDAARFEGAP